MLGNSRIISGSIHKKIHKKALHTALIAAVFVLAAVILMPAVSANGADEPLKEYLPPTYAYSTNYYDGYGTPDIYASLLGDPEFKRGETANIQVNLVNKGVPYGFKSATSVGTDEAEHAVSLKELEYETLRTTAVGVKVELLSTDLIDVEPATSYQTLKELKPGELPEKPLVFTITISDKAPAGDYYLLLPISYEYQSAVRMSTGAVARLGLPNLDHSAYYTSANKTLLIPIRVKESADFEVVDVSGNLTAGSICIINATYRNIGELAAEDAVVRVVVMRPLSVRRSVAGLGTIGPGESRTASFEITADSNAVVKNYGINSEIKYFDEDGETAFSDNLKVSVPLTSSEAGIGAGTWAAAGVLILMLYMIVNVMRNIRKYM